MLVYSDERIAGSIRTAEEQERGILATRSSQRLNPAVNTLVRVEVVDKKNRRVILSCCELINGTPILDMKVRSGCPTVTLFTLID